MNLWVLIAVVAVMAALRFAKPNMLGWLAAWWLAVYAIVKYGIEPPLPSSIVGMFLGIVAAALFTYVFCDSHRLEATKRPIVRFLVDRKFSVPLIVVALALPAIVAARVYVGMSREIGRAHV